MIMKFDIKDLEKIPGPKARGFHRGMEVIKLNKPYLYFSADIAEDLGVEEGQTVDLRMLPNNKGFLIDLEGHSFTFRRSNRTQKRRVSLCLSGMEMWEYLRKRFSTNEFKYKKLDGYVIVYPAEKGAENAE